MKAHNLNTLLLILLSAVLLSCKSNSDSSAPAAFETSSSNIVSEYVFNEGTSDCRNADNELGYNKEVGECTDFQELSQSEIESIDYQNTNIVGSNISDIDLSGTGIDEEYILENSLLYSDETIISDGSLIKDIDMESALNNLCSKLQKSKGKGLKKGLSKKCKI